MDVNVRVCARTRVYLCPPRGSRAVTPDDKHIKYRGIVSAVYAKWFRNKKLFDLSS